LINAENTLPVFSYSCYINNAYIIFALLLLGLIVRKVCSALKEKSHGKLAHTYPKQW